jgi:hypothetical protein
VIEFEIIKADEPILCGNPYGQIEGIETPHPQFTVQCLILEGSRLRYLCPDPNANDARHNPERSFHIFYHLLAHGHPALEIKSIQDTFEGKFDRASAAEGWRTVNAAMVERKSASVVAQTWDVLAAVILLLCSRRADDACGYIGKAKELLGIPMAMELVASRTSPADVKARLLQISVNIYRRLFSVSKSFESAWCDAGRRDNTVYLLVLKISSGQSLRTKKRDLKKREELLSISLTS